MFKQFKNLFVSKEETLRQSFLKEHQLEFDEEKGFILADIILNEALGKRLEYLSNRRMKRFDDLEALYFAAMMINEKIDLEIATQRFALNLDNNEQNLREFQQIVKTLNDYYRQFIRAKR